MLNLLSTAAASYSYTTTTTTTSSGSGFVWILVGLAFVFLLIAVVAMWKVFEKAGEAGWKAIIPVYNTWILFEISGKPGWWALLTLIPYLGGVVVFVLYILAMLELARRFGKSTAFAVFGLIIFSVVGFLMLGFGDAKYQGSPVITTTQPAVPPKA